jgi:hypothetical protein
LRQKCRPTLSETSKMTNLYAQVVNRLSPRNCPSLRGDGDRGVRGRLIGQVIQFGTGDPQSRAVPSALPLRDAQQHLVQPGQRRLPLLTPAGERTQPFG